MTVLITKIVIIVLFFNCLEVSVNGEDEGVSNGNSTVYVQWYLGDDTKHKIHCKPKQGTPAPKLNWLLNKEMTINESQKIKSFQEPDGSMSLEFENVEYDIMTAYGQVDFAEYSCVATGAGRATNYTSFVILVREPRSSGTVAGAVILLLLFLGLATLIAWKLKFNEISTNL